jgi:hypothetical protein
MIAARQIAFGKAAGAKKPYDAEIEYLESTGTQYIDLGFLQDKQYRAEMDVSIPFSSDKGNCVICGANQTTSIGSYLSAYNGTTKYIQMFVTGSSSTRILANDNRAKITIDTAAGMLSGYGSTAVLGEINVSPFVNYMIFASRPATKSWAGTRFYSFKYESDLHSVDFIPVRVGNIGYMYDRVSGKLFGNQGTGEFMLGADI